MNVTNHTRGRAFSMVTEAFNVYQLSTTSQPPPVANAGSDQAITLPTNKVDLSGSGSSAGGSITGYNWTKLSGPSAGTITNANSASTTVTGLAEGTYQFQLKVTDNKGATATDVVNITVNAVTNQAPVANAGPDQAITLPTVIANLSGSGSDADGTIASYNWTKISGPSAGIITDLISAVTTITGLVQGVYKYELKVTDNSGATGRDTVQVTVNGLLNQAPTADAGSNKTITLPTSTVNLSGSGSDADGTISSYAWTKISGPSSYTIADTSSAVTDVTGLVQGVYQFQLTVTDNDGATGTDVMQVTVNTASNQTPTADAGSNKTITLPTSTVNLSGSGSDADGTISSYAWTKISGPSSYTIADTSSAVTECNRIGAGRIPVSIDSYR